MPRIVVRPQNRWIVARKVANVSNAASREALHDLRDTHSAFVHTQTPLPAFDQTRVHVTHGLGFGVDEACVAAYRKSQWKPAEQDGVAVAVVGVPESCAVNEI